MCRHHRTVFMAFFAGMLLCGASAAHSVTPDQLCHSKQSKAAGRYASCVQNALAGAYVSGTHPNPSVAVAKCVAKYAATWPKIQPFCGGSVDRYTTSVLTVGDRLTGLEWQKKLGDNTTVWGVSRQFSLSTDGVLVPGDGTAFTPLPAPVRECFASHCDWRLPTLAELLTIREPPDYPSCQTLPCINPIFGPMPSSPTLYWSSSSRAADPTSAWGVLFDAGLVFWLIKTDYAYVRAVRGGL
ncbi:MAG TPA: DUF1566 domain-containing protein [Candidatus Binatia bacterium]|nr:DUF1566 domain-containing protein [Candidatus Binatia bacterium]